MKYDFEALYKNATMLDRDFLQNEFGYDLGVAEDNIIYKNYYNYIINAIYENDIYRPSAQDVEKIISRYGNEGVYLFLMAQAYQLKYDMDNGRNAMIRGEDGSLDLNRDTEQCLRRIGLLRKIKTQSSGGYCGCLEI